jgi:hypothetical protein
MTSSENWLPIGMRMNSMARSVSLARKNLETAIRHHRTGDEKNKLKEYEIFLIQKHSKINHLYSKINSKSFINYE